MAASRLSKGPVTEVVRKFKWFPMASPEKYGGSWLKNAWKEVPELVLSLTMSVTSMGMLIYMFQQNEKDLRAKDRPYKKHYTVYRPDDPRIENLKARPQYYNPEGAIPDVQSTEKSEILRWYGKKTMPTKADGSYAKHLSLKSPTTPPSDNKTLE